jgi:hypothetical protein
MPRAILCSFIFATLVWPQAETPLGSEASPLEAFAGRPGVRITLSRETSRIEQGETRLTVTALVLEDNGASMRGVKISLSAGDAREEIYLDEEGVERTRKALNEIAAGVKRNPPRRNGCMGAAAFWPLYKWPWNKYHELNADYCGAADGAELVLSARGKRQRFRFPGEDPAHFADMISAAMDQAKQH